MADSKITALTAITTVNPATYPLVIVDTSDTSMAITGTTKKVTTNQLLGSGGTATLASATITGDLTVDTNTLKVVSASDVVGINTTSPLTGNDAGLTIGAIGTVKALNIGLQNTFARLREKDAIDAFAITTNITASNTQDDATKSSWKARMGFGNGNDNFIISRSGVGSTTFYDLLAVSTGSCVWYDGAGGTRMTLNATGLGVGVIPSGTTGNSKISIVGGVTYDGNFDIIGNFTSSATASAAKGVLLGYNNSTNNGIISAAYGGGTEGLTFWTHNGSSWGQRMELTATGNVGIGVTPSAGGGCLQLKSGITFPATQVASSDANTLDDYEEGTWTATLKGSVSDPTTPVTATGRYTKIGRQVSIQLFVNNVTTTGASGRIQIDGLPFANNGSVEAISNVGFYNMATFTGVPFGLTSASSTVVDMWSSVSAGVFQAVNYNPGSVQYVWVNLTYTV